MCVLGGGGGGGGVSSQVPPCGEPGNTFVAKLDTCCQDIMWSSPDY